MTNVRVFGILKELKKILAFRSNALSSIMADMCGSDVENATLPSISEDSKAALMNDFTDLEESSSDDGGEEDDDDNSDDENRIYMFQEVNNEIALFSTTFSTTPLY
ncbi:Oidioi.mRNA.OKI2018_I69.chr2.g5306.t1.cds [Oikopleura dioica]|uniref:Oidioi.mRNA.OKI2018_I69.chr2.g5306.t1.cds n=1 Tax=Oikopleura dioica TaxID=34765 RepID=A0ABN7T3A3_OIKDI|nr:Oidioi.mRNA.OKI2018_I69.chr2.g5306.t1.cds [Oikopleura dioica]